MKTITLDNIQARHPEDEAGTDLPTDDVEFGIFAGEQWIMSVTLTRERARDLLADLKVLLHDCTS